MTGADTAQFTIELIDKITGPSQKAAAAIEDINKQLKKSKGALAGLSGKGGDIFKSALGGVATGLSGIIGKLMTAVKWAFTLGTTLAAAAAGWVTQSVVSMGIFADASRRSFAALTGGEAQGAAAFERVRKTADLLGENVQQTAESFKGLLAMQFKVGEAEELIKISADLKAVTGHAEATQRAITAITQIKAKGRLQSEELVGQLAEAGVSTTLVYDQLSKKLGKTREEVRALISAGKIDADTGIWAIKEAIKTKVHEKTPGEAAVGFSNKTLTGLLQRLQNAPSNLFLAAAEAIESSFESVKDTLRDIIGYIESIDANKIAEFVKNVLDWVKQIVPLALEFASGFGEAFGEVLDQMKTGDDLTTRLEDARAMGVGLAKVIGWTLWVFRQIEKVILFLTTPFGKFVALVTVGVGLFLKILSVVGLVAEGFGLVAGGAGGMAGIVTGWGLFTSALATAAGWLVAIGSTIGTIIVAIVTSPVTLALAIGALIAAWGLAIVKIVEYREEIAKFMLWVWDAANKAMTEFILGIARGIWKAISALWDAIKNLGGGLVDFFTGGKSLMELGIIGDPSKATARALGQPAPKGPAKPQLNPDLQSAMGPRSQTIRTDMTVNVTASETEGMSAEQVGDVVGSRASEQFEGFLSDQNAQFGMSSAPQPSDSGG